MAISPDTGKQKATPGSQLVQFDLTGTIASIGYGYHLFAKTQSASNSASPGIQLRHRNEVVAQALPRPNDLVRKITVSQRAWLKAQTAASHHEDAVIDVQTDSKTYHAIKRFLAAVDQA